MSVLEYFVKFMNFCHFFEFAQKYIVKKYFLWSKYLFLSEFSYFLRFFCKNSLSSTILNCKKVFFKYRCRSSKHFKKFNFTVNYIPYVSILKTCGNKPPKMCKFWCTRYWLSLRILKSCFAFISYISSWKYPQNLDFLTKYLLN